jgi:cytochrome P450
VSGDAPVGPDVESIDYRRCADPRTYFSGLRQKGPIDTEEGYEGRIQVLTQPGADEVLRHPDVWSSGQGANQFGGRPLIPLQIDPPDHARYRRLLDPVFAPKRIGLLEPEVVSRTGELIDRFANRGSCDFSVEFSIPLPTAIFLGILGLPMEDLEQFLTMKDNLIRPAGATVEDRQALRERTGQQVYELFEGILKQRTQEPRDDVITWLKDAEVEGEKLSTEEILDITYLLLMAGLDTVTISLQCIFHHLATHPDHRRMVSDDLALVPAVVEELMRWETPVQGVTRVATRDTEVLGQQFSMGSRLQVSLASVNTSPDTAPGYDQLDFHREDNRHMAFGGGIHRCLGSHLARLELRAAVREWHRLIPDYEVAPGAQVIWNGYQLRGIDHLPLVWPSP